MIKLRDSLTSRASRDSTASQASLSQDRDIVMIGEKMKGRDIISMRVRDESGSESMHRTTFVIVLACEIKRDKSGGKASEIITKSSKPHYQTSDYFVRYVSILSV